MHQNLTVKFSGEFSINAADLEFVYQGTDADQPEVINGEQYQQLDAYSQNEYAVKGELHKLLEIAEDFKTDMKFEKPYVRYIVMVFGYWGAGETIEEAEKNLRKAGGKKKDKQIVYRFESFLPFAPSDRDANETEADVYVTGLGDLCHIRCEQDINQCSLQSC